MVAKQKAIFIVVTVVFLSMVTTFFAPIRAFADYKVTDGTTKCADGNPPATSLENGNPVFTCKGTAPATPQQTDNGTGVQGTDNKGATPSANGSSCAIDKIGWLLCPIMEKVATISDKAFNVLSDNFLQIDAQLVSTNITSGGQAHENGTKVAWDIAKNLANIMFVIAFLIIIISQVTGYGVSNYGIKKMIPRLIIAALAVNVSYFICQFAVDLSNIMGYEIQRALAQISNSIGPSVFGTVSNYNPTDTSQGVVGTVQAAADSPGILFLITTGALASVVLVYFMLPTLVSIVPLILITIVTIIIILLLRKALIVLLIVMSPIAFVLYLLPNTERFFTKWMKMFMQLLMVFPIVGLLFGAGQLASTIILVAGASDDAPATSNCTSSTTTQAAGSGTQNQNTNNNTGNSSGWGNNCQGKIAITGGKNGNNNCSSGTQCNANSTVRANWTVGLVATGVAVAPLLAVWAVLKGALAAAGAIGGKISGAIEKGVAGVGNNAVGKPLGLGAKGLQNRIGQNAAARWQNLQAKGLEQGAGATGLAGLAGGYARRKSLRDARLSGSKSDLERQQQEAVLGSGGSYASGFSSAGQERARRAAEAAEAKSLNEDIQNFEASFVRQNLTSTDISNLANGMNVQGMQGGAAQKAAIKKIVEETNTGAMEALSQGLSGDMQRYLGQSIKNNYSAVKGKSAHLVDNQLLDSMIGTGATQTNASLNAAADRAMGSSSADLWATQKSEFLSRAQANVTASPASANSMAAKNTARALRSNTQLFDKMSRDAKIQVANIGR